MIMKHLDNYLSPAVQELEIALEDSACLMASNATGEGFTFGEVIQDETFKDTEWIFSEYRKGGALICRL